MSKGRVTGFRGIFFKTYYPEATKKWGYKSLKLVANEYVSHFQYRVPKRLLTISRLVQEQHYIF